ncbi:hypothetical protein [Sporichthya sp.]|uniref:hypothetical protein n=1 Tax=Sporichthya sp. TaxID=65475 RepID=UPI0025CDF726|nr:hypothetical protein [Sporichthya sp.]
MTWGSIEREPEVTDWLNSLSTEEFQHVRFYVELLRDKGATLKEPHTRQLDGKCANCGSASVANKFASPTGRLRTADHPADGLPEDPITRGQRADRARRAMKLCQDQQHTLGSGHDG